MSHGFMKANGMFGKSFRRKETRRTALSKSESFPMARETFASHFAPELLQGEGTATGGKKQRQKEEKRELQGTIEVVNIGGMFGEVRRWITRGQMRNMIETRRGGARNPQRPH